MDDPRKRVFNVGFPFILLILAVGAAYAWYGRDYDCCAKPPETDISQDGRRACCAAIRKQMPADVIIVPECCVENTITTVVEIIQ